ncbi:MULTISPECIES: HDOD domain-containing protein [unclassified Thioalkalivibrio]|uniref:HDOD domain-containing protein n=1 Tax=unclassified Thioalkalivibrio TaxID=2621013 RepID=UPI00036E46B3|nr:MULTISPECIES: HDOD domain-containing protein [unclassified Thioalkalivibrio]
MSEMNATESLKARVQSADKLLAMPQVVFDVARLLEDDASTPGQIASSLGRDPGLVALVLRLANSPVYAQSRSVDTVERAVNLLGRDTLQRLVVAGAITRATGNIPDQERLPLEVFWRHSAYCAVIARHLADRVLPRQSGSVFLAGLLHDLGKLLLFTQSPEAAHRAFLSSLDIGDGLSPQGAEREQLGFDHAELGGALAAHWGLPDGLVACVAGHHHPRSAPEAYRTEVTLVHLANTGAHLAEIDSRDWADAPPVDAKVWEMVGLGPDDLLQAVEAAQHEVVDVEALCAPGPE